MNKHLAEDPLSIREGSPTASVLDFAFGMQRSFLIAVIKDYWKSWGIVLPESFDDSENE